MAGATSSSVYSVEVERGGSTRGYVLRLFTLERWLAQEPDLASHEAAALQAATHTGLPVPELIDFLPGPAPGQPGDPAGFGAPAVLMTRLPGRVELLPTDEDRWLEVMARSLAALHDHPAPAFDWRYGSWVEPANVVVPAHATDPGLWEAAVAAYEKWRPTERGDTFLHRDYHAMNVLFDGAGRGLRVTGVVDWVNACIGPAAADVAHCRIDLVKMKGVHAADRFLESYSAARGGFDYQPAWDLEAVFDVAVPDADVHGPWQHFGLSELSGGTVRARVEEHVRRALVDLGAA